MVSTESGHGGYVDVGASVRHNTGAAAVAAGLLIFFGFIYPFARTTGPGSFATGESILFFTLRAGGIVMVGLTIWLSLGHLPALAADAISSVVLGVMIAVAGVFMVLGGGWWAQTLIIIVSGATFVSSGLRNFGDFLALRKIDREADDEDEEDDELAVLSTGDDSPLKKDVAEARIKAPRRPPPDDQPELVDIDPIRRPKKGQSPLKDQPIHLEELGAPPPPAPPDSPGSTGSESYLSKLARKQKRVDH